MDIKKEKEKIDRQTYCIYRGRKAGKRERESEIVKRAGLAYVTNQDVSCWLDARADW